MTKEHFSEFNITIENKKGVSPIGEETKIIARAAAKLQAKTALDMGCGTGFIAIYLNTLGIHCDAADINENALTLTKTNAQKNNLTLRTYYSNLFSNITQKYDLITFNAPYGNTGSNTNTKVLEYLKSFIPKGTILTKVLYRFIRKGRKSLTKRFLNEAQTHLNPNGKLILLMDQYEMDLLKEKSHTKIQAFLDGYIVLVEEEIL